MDPGGSGPPLGSIPSNWALIYKIMIWSIDEKLLKIDDKNFHNTYLTVITWIGVGWVVWLTVLKTGPDRPVRPVQPGASPVRLKASKPVNNRSTTGKPAKNQSKTGVEPKIFQKMVRYPVRFLKPWFTLQCCYYCYCYCYCYYICFGQITNFFTFYQYCWI